MAGAVQRPLHGASIPQRIRQHHASGSLPAGSFVCEIRILSGWSAPPRFCKAGEGNELLCSRRCRWSASCARATATTSATCKAPGCGNLGILAARLREQARCGPHNTAVATDRDSTAAFIARPPHPVCYFQCTRAMPRDRRLPLWGVLCRCLTALQTTRRRASGSAHVLSHRLYPLQAKRLHILLRD